MISLLNGTIVEKGTDKVTLLLQSGVGYAVFVAGDDITKLQKDVEVTLHCYHHITDRSQELYGFLTPDKKEIFLLLVTHVQGVGPKSALKIVSKVQEQALTGSVARQDPTLLHPYGVKGKTAEKIVQGLKGKLDLHIDDESIHAAPLPVHAEAIDALLNLGYSKEEAQIAIQKIPAGETELANIIKEILKTI